MKNWPFGVRVAICVVMMIISMIMMWYPILCKGETYALTTVVVSLD